MVQQEETKRAVYVQRIDPEQREAYIDAHDDVPEGVTEAMACSGITDFELYVREDIAVCILEAEDVSAYFDAMADNESIEEWERFVAQFKRDGVDVDAAPDEQIPLMKRIWSFTPDF